MSVKLYLQIPPIPFFSKEEEDYWVEQYSINGFKHSESSHPSYWSVNNIHLFAALQFYTDEVRFIVWVSAFRFSCYSAESLGFLEICK